MRSLIDISYLKIYSDNKIQFKFIKFLLVFYVTYDILLAFIACKVLSENFNLALWIPATALVSFAFILDDIITEVYGIKNSAIFYSSMVLTRIIVAISLYIISSHLVIAKYLLFISFYHPIIYTFSWYINVYLLTRWKVLMQGKYFWLRSIGSSGIVTSVFCLFLIIEDIKFSNWSLHQIIFGDFILSYILRISFIIIFSFPANFIVNILKIIEYQNKNTNGLSFNPFRSSVNTR